MMKENGSGDGMVEEDGSGDGEGRGSRMNNEVRQHGEVGW